jgi:hypothetical protein
MSRPVRIVKLLAISASTGVLFGNSCLVEDFWANKFSEIVNRAIFGVINAALTGTVGPI